MAHSLADCVIYVAIYFAIYSATFITIRWLREALIHSVVDSELRIHWRTDAVNRLFTDSMIYEDAKSAKHILIYSRIDPFT